MAFPKRQGIDGRWVDFLNPGLRYPSPSFNLHPELAPSKDPPPQYAAFSLSFTAQWLCFRSTKPTARDTGICPEAPLRLGKKKIRGQTEPKRESWRPGLG